MQVASSDGASYYFRNGRAGACRAYIFFFHLVYPIFLFKCLVCWETAGHSEIYWSRPLLPSGSCQLLTEACSLSIG